VATDVVVSGDRKRLFELPLEQRRLIEPLVDRYERATGLRIASYETETRQMLNKVNAAERNRKARRRFDKQPVKVGADEIKRRASFPSYDDVLWAKTESSTRTTEKMLFVLTTTEEAFRMATMIDGESYLERVLIRPLSQSSDTTLYLWPLRCLKSKMGGPTFDIDVKGKESFPEGLVDTASQLSWSLTQIREQGQQLLAEAGYPDEVASLDQEMVGTALEAVMAHLEKEGDLRSKAIEQGLIVD
jgi:hypothetical protein